jgi:Sec-independent protein translocase protein TatA
MPAFEGLFDMVPGLDNLVQDLLFTLATWHAHAKYRLHTASTIKMFHAVTRTLGGLMRKFRKSTINLKTKELKKKREARLRRAAKKAAKAAKEGRNVDTDQEEPLTSLGKAFNLITYKWHALADYVPAIIRLGTTNNYNSQVVS